MNVPRVNNFCGIYDLGRACTIVSVALVSASTLGLVFSLYTMFYPALIGASVSLVTSLVFLLGVLTEEPKQLYTFLIFYGCQAFLTALTVLTVGLFALFPGELLSKIMLTDKPTSEELHDFHLAKTGLTFVSLIALCFFGVLFRECSMLVALRPQKTSLVPSFLSSDQCICVDSGPLLLPAPARVRAGRCGDQGAPSDALPRLAVQGELQPLR